MFTLEDGREQLYQWDLDRRIIVNDEKICEVHFCNRTSDCSLVVEVIDGYANIPNILLQDARPIRAYAYCDDKYTLTEQQFSVKARTKPSDYLYEETTVIRIDVLIDKAEEAITTASELTEYFDTHKLKVDDDGEGNVTLEGVTTGGVASVTSVNGQTGDVQTRVVVTFSDDGDGNMLTFKPSYTSQEIYAAYLSGQRIEAVDSAGTSVYYLTFSNADRAIFEKAVIAANRIQKNTFTITGNTAVMANVKFAPSEYITETELNDKGYQTASQVTTLINEALGVIENGSY